MLIDCDSCTARPRACGDCIVTHLLQVGPVRGGAEDSWSDPWEQAGAGGGAPAPDLADGDHQRERHAELTESEVAAVAVLSAGGLVPPLRLVTPARPAPAPVAGATGGRAGRRGGPRTRTG